MIQGTRESKILVDYEWGDFHALSRFAPSKILEEKWGTTRSLDFGGKWMFCSILVFHVRDMSSRLISDIYTLC